jgi:hypothetical protein
VSLFHSRSAAGRSDARAGAQPSLLVATDDRAARAVRVLDEAFAAAPADELRAWARLAPRLDGRARRARRWLAGAGVLAAASAVGASALVLWHGRPAVERQAEPRASAPAIVALPPSSIRPTTIGVGPIPPSPDVDVRPGERPEAQPIATGLSVLSSGARARLSRGGRATYFPATNRGYLLLEDGTLELESGAGARRAADRPLDVRVAGFQIRGGGRFKIAARGRRVNVVVEEGEVAVWSSVRMVARVVAGERWSSAPALAAPADDGGEPRDCLRLARDGVTGDAIACLESQSAEPGLTGEIALLELARIRRDVKGDLPGAERLLADHERRFPQSALAIEARSGRIELLLRLDRPDEALAEAQRLGGSEAIYWRAVSLTALARRDEARAAFEEYLRRPDIRRRREATRELDELRR